MEIKTGIAQSDRGETGVIFKVEDRVEVGMSVDKARAFGDQIGVMAVLASLLPLLQEFMVTEMELPRDRAVEWQARFAAMVVQQVNEGEL